jgi:hypothetical protein
LDQRQLAGGWNKCYHRVSSVRANEEEIHYFLIRRTRTFYRRHRDDFFAKSDWSCSSLAEPLLRNPDQHWFAPSRHTREAAGVCNNLST